MMHTQAVKEYMTGRHCTYKITQWDSNEEIYWIEKYDKDGKMIDVETIYNIHKLFQNIKQTMGGDL